MSFYGETSGGIAACQLFSQAKLYSCFLDFNLFAPKSALNYNLENTSLQYSLFSLLSAAGDIFFNNNNLYCVLDTKEGVK